MSARSRVSLTFNSLAVRNYRIFFVAQLVSVTGTWMQTVAQSWLVFRLTGSALALGVTMALQFSPTLLFASFGGLVADRADKRKLLMTTQASAAALAVALAALTLTGNVRLWMVWVLAFGLGCVNAFDFPARQSFVAEIVGRNQVANAVSLNSAVFTAARLVGPAVAGVLIALVGTGWCFLYNGISYLPVVAALTSMREEDLHRSRPVVAGRGQIVEGLRYAWSHRELRIPLLLMAVIGTLAFNFQILLPLMARNEFHGASEVFGLLLSTMGFGAFIGALVSASRASPSHRLLGLAAAVFGAFLTGAALAPTLPLEVIFLIPMGAFMVTVQATANSLLQLNSDQAFRGRVMALYVIVFLGTAPIGGPLVGLIAERFGARAGMGLGGLAALVAGFAVLWLAKPRLDPAVRPGVERLSARPGRLPNIGP